MSFAEFGFDERIQKGIDEAGFIKPTPVQSQCFDLLVNQDRDVYAQSQTGSGKTAAFLLGIFQFKLVNERYRDSKALIIVPTRELAVQIKDEAEKLGCYTSVSAGAVFGGGGYAAQEKMLKEGVDILVGTPGRLMDFDRQGKITFANYDFLVIDEADRLFDMGFIDDLGKIIKKMKPNTERRTMLFSATLSVRVGNLAWEYMDNPGEVIIEPEKVTVDTVTQELYHVGKDEKMKLLLGLMRSEQPSNAVIFTNTRHMAWEICKRLEINGYKDVISMAGDIPQSKRLRIVDELKRGRHKYMVATDVAARGLHIDELQMVINYDVPLEPEIYVHRAGRTARAGKVGKTITLACEEYVYGLPAIEKLLGIKIPVKWADDSLIISDKSEGMKFSGQVRQKELKNEGREAGHYSKERRTPASSGYSQQQKEHSETGKSSSRKTGYRSESQAGRRKINRRVLKIQSAVSMVAGRDVLADKREKSTNSVPGAKKPVPGKSRAQGAKKSSSASSRSNSVRNRSSDSKIEKKTREERLAYYASKYGENFNRQNEKPSGKGGKRKQDSRSFKGKKSVPGNSPKNYLQRQDRRGTGNFVSSRRNERSSGNAKKTVLTKDRESSTVLPGRPDEAKPGKKRGFLRLLFGKRDT